MEREFGAEIVRTFGARLRHIYETDDLGLTEQMVTCLEQLARAEKQEREEDPGTEGSESPQNGFSVRFPLPTS